MNFFNFTHWENSSEINEQLHDIFKRIIRNYHDFENDQEKWH